MNERYVEPTTVSRLKLAIATLLAIAASIAMELWWSPLMAYIRALPLCDQLPWLRGISVGFACLFAIACFSTARAGILTLKANQSPFPGAWLWSRTRLKEGLRARIDGYVFLVVAAIMALAPVAVGYALRVNVIFCIPVPCGCQ
jgi:hypothetical protein